MTPEDDITLLQQLSRVPSSVNFYRNVPYPQLQHVLNLEISSSLNKIRNITFVQRKKRAMGISNKYLPVLVQITNVPDNLTGYGIGNSKN